MSDIQLESGIDTDNDRVKTLVDSLPTHFPKTEKSENYKIYGPIAEQADEIVAELENVRIATTVQKATSIAELKELAKPVDVRPHKNEGLEHFRTRVLGSYQNITSQATISDLISTASYLLNVKPKNIGYSEPDTPGLIVVGLPKRAIDDAEFDTVEIVSLLQDNVAAGYKVQTIATGTFEYMSIGDTSDNVTGYAGLDTDGNITSNGGTYSTTMN